MLSITSEVEIEIYIDIDIDLQYFQVEIQMVNVVRNGLTLVNT